MGIKDIIDRIKPSKEEMEEGEEFLEVGEETEDIKVKVVIENMDKFVDSEKILNFLRDNNVVFLRIKDLREKNISELKRTVDKLKKTVAAMGGDIVGVDENFLILTPKLARIYRGKAG